MYWAVYAIFLVYRAWYSSTPPGGEYYLDLLRRRKTLNLGILFCYFSEFFWFEKTALALYFPVLYCTSGIYQSYIACCDYTKDRYSWSAHRQRAKHPVLYCASWSPLAGAQMGRFQLPQRQLPSRGCSWVSKLKKVKIFIIQVRGIFYKRIIVHLLRSGASKRCKQSDASMRSCSLSLGFRSILGPRCGEKGY